MAKPYLEKWIGNAIDPLIYSANVTRAYYIDRIRVVLTALVIFHHTAITYGAPGGWYYAELPATASLTGLLFTLFVSVNQAYFMGFFFLIAGYFTPASYDRKGAGQFCLDRLIRLGIPLVVFAITLDPLTNAIALAWGAPPAKATPFLRTFLHRVSTADWHPGPALAKFAVTGTISALATLVLSSIVLRVPGVRRVL